MEFNLHHLAIHELIKEADAAEARLFLTDRLATIEERAEQLATKLDRTFSQKDDTLQGALGSPEDTLFPGYLQQLLDEALSPAAFLSFSRDTASALQLALQGVTGAKGGYLVYADYTAYEQRFLGIFLVRDTEGIVFQKTADNAAFTLDAITYLNTDRLALACRIRLERTEEAGGRFVELIKHNKSQKEVSEYFINWVGLDRPESSRALTETFLEMVEQLPPPVDADTGEQWNEHQFQEKAVHFAMQNPHKTVNLEQFNQQFYGEQPVTQHYLQDNEISLDNEFRVDRGALRRFNNHKVSAEGLYLYFKRQHLLEGQVEIAGDQVILHAPELAEQLAEVLAMLREH